MRFTYIFRCGILAMLLACSTQAANSSPVQDVVRSKVGSLVTILTAPLDSSHGTLTVAIADFSTAEGAARTRQLGKALPILVQEVLTTRSYIKIVEREKIESVSKEIALGQSGLIDEATAQEAGRLVGARYIITGSVAELGAYFVVSGRIIDVTTGFVAASALEEIGRENLIAVSSKYVVVKRYALVPAFQSAIIPGWGQFYNDEPGKGIFFASMAAVGAAGLGLSYLAYQGNTYNQADNREYAENQYKQWKRLYYIHMGSIAWCATVWGIAVIDAFLTAHSSLSVPNEQVTINRGKITPIIAYSPYGTVKAGVTVGF